MITSIEIARLAGYLEGEGCFGTQRYNRPNKPYTYPRIQVSATDRDVVEWAAGLLGARVKGPYGPKSPNRKAYYVCTATGAAAVGWMMTLYSMMGERRKGQIRKALSEWRNKI